MHDRQQTWIWIVSLVVFLRAAGGSVVLIAEMPEEPTPTHRDVPYGPHARNVLDFWQAEGVGPRPLLVYIHGGGWTGGDKKQDPRAWLPVHEMGISYAAFNYRLAPQDPLPAPVLDAARAIQYLRTRAKEWNIDTSRIALTGGSAGGCSSLWLLLHDDLADPQSSDPVLRESTRVCAATVFDAQTSIDPKVIEPWVGPNILQHRMVHLSVAEPTMQSALDNYETHRAAYAEFSPYNHV
ncbi:MAG: alpha/beta hydrolase, partial [Planctomycetota bacterium]|nr:alpha/beta hydrolase [Planctomycetota bacterium]